MLKQFVGLAILGTLVVSYGCSTQPSTSQIQSFSAPLAIPTVAPIPPIVGANPVGTVTMTMSTTVDHDNNITNATATFVGNFSGFPSGSTITDATVNNAAAGVTGPVVVDLMLQPGQVTLINGAGSLNATISVSPSVANQIQSNPANFYFLVSTANFPNGLLRGQF